jgi:hypothetical protein
LNTLATSGPYIQPPVVVVEYAELSPSDIGTGTLIQVRKKMQEMISTIVEVYLVILNFFIIKTMLYVLAFFYLLAI